MTGRYKSFCVGASSRPGLSFSLHESDLELHLPRADPALLAREEAVLEKCQSLIVLPCFSPCQSKLIDKSRGHARRRRIVPCRRIAAEHRRALLRRDTG